jgi:hypothetical protein
LTLSRKRRRRRLARRLRTFPDHRSLALKSAASKLGGRIVAEGVPAIAPQPTLLRSATAELRSWSLRRWLVAAGVGVAVAFATGIPTDVVPNPLYVRMTPVVWWNYPVWAFSAVLAGLIAATYVRARPKLAGRRLAGGALGGGVLSLFAVGCPICNNLVVAALGAGGALSYFGPAQPVIGIASIALLGLVLGLRLRALAACSVWPASAARTHLGTSRKPILGRAVIDGASRAAASRSRLERAQRLLRREASSERRLPRHQGGRRGQG